MRNGDIKAVNERRDVRLKESKLRNWRKRYGREVEGVSMVLSEKSYVEGISLSAGGRITMWN
jgi:hypothetical protein